MCMKIQKTPNSYGNCDQEEKKLEALHSPPPGYIIKILHELYFAV